MPTGETQRRGHARRAAVRASRPSHVQASSTTASGARFGRIAIAALIARPAASGRRATVSTSASVHAAVTGTSLIAFIS